MSRAGTVCAIAAGAAATLWCAVAGAALAPPRVALVVGNGGYDPANIARLDNPVNDARLMAKTLESIGFEVSLATDADRNAMTEAIEEFGKRLRRAGSEAVGLFYYAGHGVEAGGVNYLIPLGAEIESAMEFQGDAVPAQWVLSWMEAAGNRLNMVVLDACRNNPYGGKRGGARGLGRMDAPSGSLIAYAAGPGQAADDGEGGNSPYTSALAEALLEPGLKVEDVFKRVRVRVERETGGEQTPWENSSLKGDFYFVPREGDEEALPVVGGGTSAADEARNAYDTAVRENTIAAYRAVVEHFPGFYATLAQRKVEELEAAAVAEERRARRRALAEKLGREFSPDAVGENGWTDLHYAAALDLPGLARELVERGMEVDVRLDESGERFGEGLKRTLRELGRDFDNWTSDGNTPLHVAGWADSLSVVEYLVGQGADVNAKWIGGWTVLHTAAFGDSLSVVEYLVGQGLDVNAKNNYGWTVLHAAARYSSLSVVEYLVGQGADVNAKDNTGSTVLHAAARFSSLSVVKYLVGQGLDVNAKNDSGWTVLHHAPYSDSVSVVVEYLAGHGADVNAKTDSGWTVLHHAVLGRNALSMVANLVERGADVNAKTVAERRWGDSLYPAGSTPRDVARIRGRIEVSEYLRSRTG